MNAEAALESLGPESDERRTIMYWLRQDDPDVLRLLWEKADSVRKAFVGDEVHLRGLIEVSNCCVRQCAYCGLRCGNSRLDRYRMSHVEVLECVAEALRYGMRTVVLQGAEDYGLDTRWVESIVRRIKSETDLAVVLSLGERPESELALWRKAGADRYYLRFETSDVRLYRSIHPAFPSGAQRAGAASGRDLHDRVEILKVLDRLGYQVGTGIMIGIPGQSYASLVDDILLFRSLDPDMIGMGPYLPNPATPMGCGDWKSWLGPQEQVPASELMTFKVMALARILCPEANIPSTTALAEINTAKGHETGLMRGANVIMPNLTPLPYLAKYEIYPKQHLLSDPNSSIERIVSRIQSVGRTVSKKPGERTRRPWIDRPILPTPREWRIS